MLMALRVGNPYGPRVGNTYDPGVGKPYGPGMGNAYGLFSFLVGNTYGPRHAAHQFTALMGKN